VPRQHRRVARLRLSVNEAHQSDDRQQIVRRIGTNAGPGDWGNGTGGFATGWPIFDAVS
jgi:hypothetical protein